MNGEFRPLEGGCRCGRVRLLIGAPPLLTMACHCTGCQRMSASAFSLSAAIPSEAFTVSNLAFMRTSKWSILSRNERRSTLISETSERRCETSDSNRAIRASIELSDGADSATIVPPLQTRFEIETSILTAC